MTDKIKNHFTDSIFYEIELTAKYCKLLGIQVFEEYKTGISPDEFAILDTLLYNPEICQRDLAKLIIKDRANTGKLLDNLEQKGYILRKLSIKNNRPVKIAELTKSGTAKAIEVSNILQPHIELIKTKAKKSNLEQIKQLLREFREILSETIETKI